MAEIGVKHQKHKKHNMSPNSLANLKPRWEKGKCPNPNGRPKTQSCVTAWLQDIARQKSTTKVDASKLTFAQAAALKHWQEAVKGDLDTYKFIAERTEGKPKESVNITSKGESIGNGRVDIPAQSFTEAFAILVKAGISPN